MPSKIHGMTGNHRKGIPQTRFYKIWGNMKQRCTNPNNVRYADYGGRGITLCKRWYEFKNFMEDMYETYYETATLDRINNSKGYTPSNCRWASYAEQNQNSRRCVMVKIGNESKPINAWCREFGIPYTTFKQRRKNGWELAKACSTPPNSKHKRKNIKEVV